MSNLYCSQQVPINHSIPFHLFKIRQRADTVYTCRLEQERKKNNEQTNNTEIYTQDSSLIKCYQLSSFTFR